MALRVIRVYVWFSLLSGLAISFFFATYQVFLASRGMDLLQINLINAFFMAGVFLFEVPTGAFADQCGRKKSVVLGNFILAISFLVYFFSDSFFPFVIAELIAAFGMTFLSGALEAWAVDALAYCEYELPLEKVFRQERAFNQAGILLGSIAGGYAGDIDIAWPWLMSACAMALCGVFAGIFMEELGFQKKKITKGLGYIAHTAREGVRYGIRNKPVLYLLSFCAMLSLCLQGLNMQWPFVFKDLFQLDVAYLGWIFAAVSVAILVGNQLSLRFARLIGNEKRALILSQAITAVGILAASTMIGVVPVLIAFLVQEGGRGLFGPLQSAYLNRRIPSESRATIISFESMVCKGGAFAGLILSGFLAKYFSIAISWAVSGSILALCVLIFLTIKNGE
jgi:MFS family permease